MSLVNPQLPKQYKNSKVLFEQNLDAWRVAAEAAFATVNLNLTQLRKDCFLATYDFDNDGNGNLPKSLQQQINDLSTGSTPLGGTTSDTWTINSDGNSVILSSIGMTSVRTFLFPDDSGTIITDDATQTLTNKTLTSPTINSPTINNATINTATINNLTVTGTLIMPAGLVGTPGLAVTGDLDTGVYSGGLNQLNIATGGSEAIRFTNSFVSIGAARDLVLSATKILYWDGSATGNTYTTESSNDNLDTYTGATLALTINNAGVTISGTRNLAVQPTQRIYTGINTWVAESAVGVFDINVDGVKRFSVNNASTLVEAIASHFAVGSGFKVAYENTGSNYHILSASNQVSLYTNSIERVRYTTNGISIRAGFLEVPNAGSSGAPTFNAGTGSLYGEGMAKAVAQIDGTTGAPVAGTQHYNIDVANCSRTAAGAYEVALLTSPGAVTEIMATAVRFGSAATGWSAAIESIVSTTIIAVEVYSDNTGILTDSNFMFHVFSCNN